MPDDLKPRVGNILQPVGDMDQAISFFSEGLGFEVKFRDGDRFAALDGGSVTIALVGEAEDVTSGTPAMSVKVDDVAAAVEAIVAAGGTVVHPAHDGPHEVRATVADPWGSPFVLYAAK